MYCKDCKYWKRGTEFHKNRGKCKSPKFIDVSIASPDVSDNDTLEYTDFESYAAVFDTGENFGCIHFEKKVN